MTALVAYTGAKSPLAQDRRRRWQTRVMRASTGSPSASGFSAPAHHHHRGGAIVD